MTEFEEKREYSIQLLKKGVKLAKYMSGSKGYYLAFSGGKDSQCVYHLAKEARVPFEAHYNQTSCEPAKLIRFIRKNYPDVIEHKPALSIYDVCKKKLMLPTRNVRFCCAVFKETYGRGTVTLLGLRHAESVRRAQRKELEFGKVHPKSMTFNEFDIKKGLEEQCFNKATKFMLSPIIDWTEADVWEYLDRKKIKHCELYDQGYKRIGCMFCTMESDEIFKRDFKNYPYIWKRWEDVAEYIVKHRTRKEYKDKWELLEWWRPCLKDRANW